MPCDEVAKKIYEKTVTGSKKDRSSELKKKWLDGPFTRENLDQMFGKSCWVPAPRFGVFQGKDKDGEPKGRPIDDFSVRFHNSCVTCLEKIDVDGVDSIVSTAKLWSELVRMARLNANWTMSTVLSDGTTLTGTLHP